MRKKYLYFALIFLIFVVDCGSFGELNTTNSKAQLISGPVRIEREWTEISPPEPLRSVSRIHKISVRTDAVDTFNEQDKTAQTLIFKNGESGTIEANLIDEQGNIYKLDLVGIGGEGGGFYLGRKPPPHDSNQPPNREPDFPHDKKYIKLKIRSSVPFQSKKIEWITEVQK